MGKRFRALPSSDLAQGEPTIVNVFASWCVECQVEHPLLLALGKEPGIRLYGIDYKDDTASARRFLGRYGNPYARVGADASGRVAIDFGVYGVPETYVVTGDGKIAYRHVGPLTEDAIKDKILPLLKPPAAAARLTSRTVAHARSFSVIPAQAGIQRRSAPMHSGSRLSPVMTRR